MFKLTPSPQFESAVTGFVPGAPADGLRVTFKYQDKDALKAWHESFATRSVAEVLSEIVVTWRDAPIEYGPTAIEKVAEIYPAFPAALIETYRRELFEARSKN